jgi:hypothetical protein
MSMNNDAFGKAFTPCNEECQYQARVDDVFNHTTFTDSPTFFSSMRLFVPGATVSFKGWDYMYTGSYVVTTLVGYEKGSWDVRPTTISYEEIDTAKQDLTDWYARHKAGMSPQDYRIQQLSNNIAWMVEHPITTCEGAKMALYTASVYVLQGVGPLAASVEDTAGAIAARKTLAWAAGAFGGATLAGMICQ